MKKLSEYATEHNITYRTAWNHFARGLISGAYQLSNGTVVIPDSNTADLEKAIHDLKNIITELKKDK